MQNLNRLLRDGNAVMNHTTVMVSGGFDPLHSEHVRFLTHASKLGRLVVAVRSDETVHALEGTYPVCSEDERLFVVRALRCVDLAFISSGSGNLDFQAELSEIRPDLFVVDPSSHHADKVMLCTELGITYHILDGTRQAALPIPSSSAVLTGSQIPYRIDLAGGWLDQPFVSSLAPGPVIVLSLLANKKYATRSGLATSTRKTAERLWGTHLPNGDPVELAKTLFACENPPGTEEIAGSQDALGITLPGLHRLDYSGQYWPWKIEPCTDHRVVCWLERCLHIRRLPRRAKGYRPLEASQIDETIARDLSNAASSCWDAILDCDLRRFGRQMLSSYDAQIRMFPNMITPAVAKEVASLPDSIEGYKLAGAGGGGYLIVVADRCPEGFESIQVRFPAGE